MVGASLTSVGPIIPLEWMTKKPLGVAGARWHMLWHTTADSVIELVEDGPGETWVGWPWLNLGLVLGEQTRWGYPFALDVDGPRAEEHLAAMADADPLVRLAIERTYTVEGARGRHIFFTSPEPIPTWRPLGDDGQLDCKGVAGYVLIPGSKHPSGSYYRDVTSKRGSIQTPSAQPPWLPCVYRESVAATDGRPALARWSLIQPAPEALLTLVTPPDGQEPERPEQWAGPISSARMLKALERSLETLRTAVPGTRDDLCNKETFRIAAMLGRLPHDEMVGDLDPQKVRAELIRAAMASGQTRAESTKDHAWADAGWQMNGVRR